MAKDKTEILRVLVYIFVFIAVILALFFDGNGMQLLTSWFTKIFTSLVYSILAGALVGAFTGNLLEREAFNTDIFGFKFNIPVAVLTFVVKIWLF